MSPARLPDKTIKAIGSGREVNLQNFGLPTILIFHYRDSASTARKINNSVREKYDAEEVFIASVLDLHSIPKIARGATEAMIGREYKKAAGELKETENPEEYVVLLPDWNGQMTKALGFSDTNKTAGIAILDESGYVHDTYQGDESIKMSLSLLEKLIKKK